MLSKFNFPMISIRLSGKQDVIEDSKIMSKWTGIRNQLSQKS